MLRYGHFDIKTKTRRGLTTGLVEFPGASFPSLLHLEPLLLGIRLVPLALLHEALVGTQAGVGRGNTLLGLVQLHGKTVKVVHLEGKLRRIVSESSQHSFGPVFNRRDRCWNRVELEESSCI